MEGKATVLLYNAEKQQRSPQSLGRGIESSEPTGGGGQISVGVGENEVGAKKAGLESNSSSVGAIQPGFMPCIKQEM